MLKVRPESRPRLAVMRAVAMWLDNVVPSTVDVGKGALLLT